MGHFTNQILLGEKESLIHFNFLQKINVRYSSKVTTLIKRFHENYSSFNFLPILFPYNVKQQAGSLNLALNL